MKRNAIAGAALLAGSVVLVALPGIASAQKGGDHGGGGGGSHSSGGGGGQSHSSGGGSRPAPSRPAPSRPSGPPVHAAREPVRTTTFVPRTVNNAGGARQQQRPADNTPATRPTFEPNHNTTRRTISSKEPAVVNARKFTKTSSGRVYDNGLSLRKGIAVNASWQHQYFPKGHYHFPYYRPTYVRGECYRSPFGFYLGVCCPYIGINDCHVYPPAQIWIDIPFFNGSVCGGFTDAGDNNMLNDPNLNTDEPGLMNAIDDITEAFQGGNIDGLVSIIDPNTQIAIYQNGSYSYSLPANDYIDLARDAIASMNTVSFNLTYLHQRSPSVFSVAGKQTYRDQHGAVQTTWVSYVLQDISGQWTLTQAGTAPGHK